MKRALFLILLMSFIPLTFAQEPLQASVSKVWTVDAARQEAFQQITYHLDLSGIPTIDPNLIENKTAVNQGGGKIGNRVITVFNDHGYCVKEQENPVGYYYSADGSLESVDVRVGDSYPLKEYKYIAIDLPSLCRKGDLISVNIVTSDGETYVFRPSGQLLSHWSGHQCYNVDGSSCGTRKIYSY